MTGPDCAVMCNLINTHTHTRSGQFMGCPSGGRGPSRERDRNPTGRSGSRRRGGGREGREGGGGSVGAGVLDSENNGRIRWQPNLIGKMS